MAIPVRGTKLPLWKDGESKPRSGIMARTIGAFKMTEESSCQIYSCQILYDCYHTATNSRYVYEMFKFLRRFHLRNFDRICFRVCVQPQGAGSGSQAIGHD